MTNNPFSMQTFPGSHLSQTSPKIQTVQCCVQATELVLVHMYSEYHSFQISVCSFLNHNIWEILSPVPNQGLQRVQHRGIVLALPWLQCLALPRSHAYCKENKWIAGFGFMLSTQGLSTCTAMPALVSTCSRIFVQCRHFLVMILP